MTHVYPTHCITRYISSKYNGGKRSQAFYLSVREMQAAAILFVSPPAHSPPSIRIITMKEAAYPLLPGEEEIRESCHDGNPVWDRKWVYLERQYRCCFGMSQNK